MRRHRFHWTHASGALLVAATLAGSSWAGQPPPLLAEQEPNDTAENAQRFEGAVRIEGAIARKGDVDRYIWELDDETAQALFRLRLLGPGGGATTVRVAPLRTGAKPAVTVSTTADGAPSVRPNVLLPPERYVISVDGPPGNYALRIDTTALRPKALATPRKGRLPILPSRLDHAAFVIDGTVTAQWRPSAPHQQLELMALGGAKVTARLRDSNGKAVATVRSGDPKPVNVGVKGTLQVELVGPPGTLIVLNGRAVGPPAAGSEVEPNNRRTQANPVALPSTTRGSGDRADHFVFHVTATQSRRLTRIRLTANEAGKTRVCVYRRSGVELTCRKAKGGGVELPPLGLPQDSYLIRVETQGPYSLALAQGKRPKASAEREPNDRVADAMPLAVGTPLKGRLDGADRDHAELRVPSPGGRYTIAVTSGPTGGSKGVTGLSWIAPDTGRPMLQTVPAAGRAAFTKLPLAPGTHRFRVDGTGGTYTLTARLDAVADGRVKLEREPNSGRPYVDALRFGDSKAAMINAPGDADGYRFAAPGPRAARFRVTPEGKLGLRVRWFNGGRLLEAWKVAPGQPLDVRRAVPAGDHRLDVSADGRRGGPTTGAYTVALDHADPLAPKSGTKSGSVSVAVALDTRTVAAYVPVAQRVGATVTVASPQGGTFELQTSTGDPALRLDLKKSTVKLAAGQKKTLQATLAVGPEVGADRPWLVSVAAVRGDARSSGTTTLVARTDAPPQRPTSPSPLPRALLGGVNVARGALHLRGKHRNLNDGVARRDAPFTFAVRRTTKREDMPTLQLRKPTEAAVEVVGVTLQAVGSEFSTVPREVAVWLSADGRTYKEHLRVRPQPHGAVQPFVLPKAVKARFVRLELSTNQLGQPTVKLGEFQVIAHPQQPVTSGATPNLLDKTVGGHTVWARPAEAAGKRALLGADDRAVVVLGFHHGRAALVRSLTWKKGSGKPVSGVTFFASVAGPTGPWKRLGTLDKPDTMALFSKRVQGKWIRYLKIETSATSTRQQYGMPVIEAREVVASRTYRTILGEWGPFARGSGYEEAHPPKPPPRASHKGHTSRAKAAPLRNTPVHGRVRRGRVEHWYAVKVPSGHRSLVLRGSGRPTLDADFALIGPGGQPVAPRRTVDDASATERRFEVTGGKRYLVRVWQPPSSVVFTWDTSGSVSGWVPLVRNAVQRFAETVTPGQEQVHLLPFGGGPLLADWEARPAQLWDALASYVPVGSSASERALRVSSELLSTTRGTKAVVVLTDALSPVDRGLWAALSTVQPRVFSAGVAAGLAGVGQDRLQSWSAVNRGHYDGVTARDELDRFFELTSARLRLPASYTLEVVTDVKPLLPPGKLNVVAEGGVGGQTVAFIVDLSGSMLRTMKGGVTRIDAAKRILRQTVRDELPKGTRVALRTLGRIGGDACGTARVSAPTADLGVIDKAVAAMAARKYAKTPIAAAIEAVADDLAGTRGQPIVVLLTDGRETCGGDARKALAVLQEKGVRARVNIVGFSLRNAKVKRTFASLAEAGGGAFFDAGDDAALVNVLKAAVKAPYIVRDATGRVVAKGAVGGPAVPLPPGRYDVVVATSPPKTFTAVEITDGSRKTLRIPSTR